MEFTLKVRLRALGEIVAVFVALAVAAALVDGAARQLPPDYATPVRALAMWGAIAAGALLLRRSGTSYAGLGLRTPPSWAGTVRWAAVGLLLAWGGSWLLGVLIRTLTDWPPLDVGYIRTSIEGNALAWLLWMALVVWGSAAFAEELLSRGFVMDRLRIAGGGGRVAVVLAAIFQAAIFGALHAVQGPSGVLITAYIGLVFAGIYYASGRNLWAPILAHGTADSVSLTLLYAGVPLPGYIG